MVSVDRFQCVSLNEDEGVGVPGSVRARSTERFRTLKPFEFEWGIRLSPGAIIFEHCTVMLSDHIVRHFICIDTE